MAFKREKNEWLLEEVTSTKKPSASYKRWSKREIKYLKENMNMTSVPMMSKKLNRTESAVRQKCASLRSKIRKTITKAPEKEAPLKVTIHRKSTWTWKESLQLFYLTTSLGLIAILGYLLFIKW